MDRQKVNGLRTTSFSTEILLTASKRLQSIWETFSSGVEHLHRFAYYLNEPLLDGEMLYKLSKNAQEQISLAEKDINRGEHRIKSEIHDNILRRQKCEKEILEFECKKCFLSESIRIKKNEIEKAKEQVSTAEQDVETHERKGKKAKTRAKIVTGVSTVLGLAGGVLASGVVIISGGLALPVVAAGASIATSGAGAIAVVVSMSKFEDAIDDLRRKECILQESEAELQRLQNETQQVKCKYTVSVNELERLKKEHTYLIDECKVITWLKESISIFHNFMNVALGRVSILHETVCTMKKHEIFQDDLKRILVKVAEHLSTVNSIEYLSQYVPNVHNTIRMIESIQSVYELTISGDSEDYI